jgi:uncharacterized protein (DUF433 family)
MTQISSTSPINISCEVMRRTPVFAGTRVPLETMIEYLEGGESTMIFWKGFRP